MHMSDASEFNADPRILQIQHSGSKALKSDCTVNRWRFTKAKLWPRMLTGQLMSDPCTMIKSIKDGKSVITVNPFIPLYFVIFVFLRQKGVSLEKLNDKSKQ